MKRYIVLYVQWLCVLLMFASFAITIAALTMHNESLSYVGAAIGAVGFVGLVASGGA